MDSARIWTPQEIYVATGFWARLRGSTWRGTAVLIPGRSVHSLWMRRTIWAVALDANRRVTAVTRLPPLRLLVFPSGTRWVLELPGDQRPPGIGTILDTG